jgi:hypothetical protein
MKSIKRLILIGVVCVLPGVASATTITADGPAAALIAALTSPGTGLTITSLSITGHSAGAAFSWGTYTNASGTYGIGPGIVISSGNVSNYGDGPNTVGNKTTGYGANATPGQEAILDAISGASTYFDATEIDIVFSLDALHNTVFFNVVFGSDEFPEFVGSTFIDGFGMLVNGTNVAFTGGFPVNVNHPSMAAIAGTELDGILAPGGVPVVQFSSVVGFGSTGNTLKFIIADRGDDILDSTAYISALGGEPGTPTPFTPTVPEPATGLLVATGVAAYFARRRRSAAGRQ